MTKYIFVTGGVVSGLGKGISCASLGRLLKARGYKVVNQKFDPYINLDPGNMSPYQHGEVFITDDGKECDLDIGHYERFTDENGTFDSNITSGRIYWNVLNKERNGDYGGQTVQVIPHITDAIKETIYRAGNNSRSDFVITEIGGTVGDIEGLPFIEAIRQVAIEKGHDNVAFVHLTLLPYLTLSGELKTKPTQHSVKELLSIGIQPDILICRTEHALDEDTKRKVALFCNVSQEFVIQNLDAGSIYEVPLLLEEEGFASLICRKLKMEDRAADLSEWRAFVEKSKSITRTVKIALIGKFVELHDAYLSAAEALRHAAIPIGADIDIQWIQSDGLANADIARLDEVFAGVSAIICPSGCDERGCEGIQAGIRYAREKKLPFLGTGYGMENVVLEFARNAAASESNPDAPSPIIEVLQNESGGGMRRGSWPCALETETLTHEAYKTELIYERHHDKFSVNPDYYSLLRQHGMVLAGFTPDERLADIVELTSSVHPWFVAASFRPEFKSRINRPHPLFGEFVKQAIHFADGEWNVCL